MNEKIIEIKLEIRGSFRGWERTPVFVTINLSGFSAICDGKNKIAEYSGIANAITYGILSEHPEAVQARWNWKHSAQGIYIDWRVNSLRAIYHS